MYANSYSHFRTVCLHVPEVRASRVLYLGLLHARKHLLGLQLVLDLDDVDEANHVDVVEPVDLRGEHSIIIKYLAVVVQERHLLDLGSKEKRLRPS